MHFYWFYKVENTYNIWNIRKLNLNNRSNIFSHKDNYKPNSQLELLPLNTPTNVNQSCNSAEVPLTPFSKYSYFRHEINSLENAKKELQGRHMEQFPRVNTAICF